jgi:DNA-binding transcriptional LysR family regulator
MNLRHLEVFHAIMSCGSMTEAARRLNISQPAVSSIVKHAESHLGMKLFQRIGGRLHPTPEALVLFPDAENIFGRLATLNRMAQNLRDGRTGLLSVAATTTLAHALLPRAISRFCKGRPDVRIQLEVLPTEQAVQRVARHEVDLGVVYAPGDTGGAELVSIGRSRVACLMRSDHPLARCKQIGPERLRSEPIVTYGPNTPMGTRIAHAFREAEVPLAATIEIGSSLTACFLASEGSGIAIIDPIMLRTGVFPDLVVRPFIPAIDVELCLLLPRDRPRSRLAERFAETVKLTAAEL